VTSTVREVWSGSTTLSASRVTVLFNIVGWPTMSGVASNSGPASGGTSVTISGEEFFGVTAVKFGDMPAQSFIVTSAWSITAVTPRASTTGAVYVTVTTARGSVASRQFTYYQGSQPISLEPSTTQDLAIGATSNLSATGYFGTGAISYAVTTGGAFCTVSGTVLTAKGVGTCLVSATIASSTAFAAATSAATTFRVSKSQQVLSWSPEPALTLDQSPYELPSATALGGGFISYSVVSTTLSSCTVVSSTRVLTFDGVGECRVKASAAAMGDYGYAEKIISFTSALASRSLTWAPQTNLTPNQSGFEPVLAVGVGEPVITYSVLSSTNGCSVNSATGALSFIGVGSCSVRASTPATSAYAAGVIDRSFKVARLSPELLWSPILNLLATQDQGDFAAASTLSDSPVSYSVTDAGTTNCALVSAQSTQLTFDSAGSCQVTASVAESTLYDASSSVKTFAIGFGSQTFEWAPTLSHLVTLEPINVSSATGMAGGGAISYAITSGAGCSMASNGSPTFSVISAGTCIVTAYAAQTPSRAAATISKVFTFSRSVPTLSWNPVLALVKNPVEQNPSAQAFTSSDAAIVYNVVGAGTSGCVVNQRTGALIANGVGFCEVEASTVATNLNEAASLSLRFSITLQPQTIQIVASALEITEGGLVALASNSQQGDGTLSYSIVSGVGCEIVDESLRAIAPGICVVQVAISADAQFASATSTLEIRVRARPMVQAPETSALALPEDAPTQEINLLLPSPDSGSQLMAGLPAAPVSAKLVANRETKTATLVAKMPKQSTLAPITETVVEVRDAKRKLIARISIKLKAGDSEVEVTIPFSSGDHSVSVFNVNDLGISAGAPTASQLVHARTFRNAAVAGGIAYNGTVAGSPIFFKAFSAELDAGDRRSLDQFAKQIGVTSKRVFITGFAHLRGSSQKEVVATSLARARNVANYLASKGVRVWITYFGAGAPVKSAGSKDRRVELRVLG